MTNKIVWTETVVQLKDLIPADYNPRKMSSKEKKDIQKSIEQFGRVEPIILNTGTRSNCVIGGHQRIKIYADLGITEVEAKIPSRELSLNEEKELNLRLNKNSGSWDMEKLTEMSVDLLLDVGFEDEDLNGIFDDVETLEDGYNIEKAKKEITEPRVRTGEIWQLGDHKLLVGDSTDLDSVQKLMDNEKADIVYEDSPYNIGLSYSKGIGGNGDKYGGI
jgi:hypothetical protein